MVNVEMVRMSAQDKKLSNPSKPSGKKTADFSRLISEKTADVKDAGAPQPDGKVQEKENCGKTEPEDKTDADADDLQAMQLCQDFAARLEWEISQPVPAYEEPSSEQEIQALDMNPEEVLQSEAAESESAARVPAESQPVLEKLPEAGKTPQTVLETKKAELPNQEVKLSADESKTPIRLHETQPEQNSDIPRPEAAEGKAGETSKETTEEKTPENFEMQKSEFSHHMKNFKMRKGKSSHQITKKIPKPNGKRRIQARQSRQVQEAKRKRQSRYSLRPRQKAIYGLKAVYSRRSGPLRQSEPPGRSFPQTLEKPLQAGCP